MVYRGTPDTGKPRPDTSSQQEEEAILSAKAIDERFGLLAEKIHIVQAALLMAMEGSTRAMVSQITERTSEEYGVDVLPSMAGQFFGAMGLRRVPSHGQNRLVLDESKLDEIRQSLMSRLDSMQPRVEEATTVFSGTSERLQDLESQLQQLIYEAERARQVRTYLRDNRRRVSSSSLLESNYEQMKSQVQRIEQVEAACAQMEERLKAGVALAKKKADLEEKLKALEAHETELVARGQDLARSEQRLERKIRDLTRRQSVVDLVELEDAIAEKRKELDGVLRELGEKKSLLSRAIGR